MSKLKDIFRISATTPGSYSEDDFLDDDLTQEDHKEKMELDKSILDSDSSSGKRVAQEADKQVTAAAADSLKRFHIISKGRCPECGDHLRRHLFVSICETCGWNTYDVPRAGKVRIHLSERPEPIEGDRCYVVKGGALIIVKDELVIARISRDAVSWIEYQWSEGEVSQRHREVVGMLEVQCGWCSKQADPEKDGFHLVHVAFGATQERYCFCSDDCFEAFRKMYPARVDRNCYDRICAECNLCSKRYDDEAEGIRVLAKDFLKMKRRSNSSANSDPDKTA